MRVVVVLERCWWVPLTRRMLITRLRRETMTRGPLPERIGEWSSA
jgi:hypothetical protein